MIVAVVGPSGAGKDTLIRGACAARPEWRCVRRVITRTVRDGSEDFEGVTLPEFEARKAAGAFALHWEAHGLHYGIPGAQVAGPGIILFNGSRAAIPEARRQLPDLRVVFVTASPAVLASRLAARGRESSVDIQARIERAGIAQPEGLADAVVHNDGAPAEGIAQLLEAIQPSNSNRSSR